MTEKDTAETQSTLRIAEERDEARADSSLRLRPAGRLGITREVKRRGHGSQRGALA